MLFGVVSGVGRGMGVVDEGGDCGRERAVSGVNMGYPIHHCNQWGLCGVVILCREGWRRGFS